MSGLCTLVERHRMTTKVLWTLMMCVAFGLVGASSASAQGGTGVAAIPQFPSTVTVGAQDVPVSLRIVNNSTGEFVDDQFQLADIELTPACGSKSSFPTVSDCPVGARDPGVLVPSAVPGDPVPMGYGVNDPTPGGNGTACAGRTFTFVLADPAQGKYELVPDSPVILGTPGTPAGTCTINFTIDVLKAPTIDSDPAQTLPGPLQTDQKARVFGTSITPGPEFGQEIEGGGTDETTVLAATPTLVTDVAPDQITLGQSFQDTATLGLPAGGPAPTGTMTFTVYNNNTCTGTPAFGPDAVAVTGATTLSPVYTPTSTGTYRVIASYSGDANYNPVGPTACLDPEEDVLVVPATLTLATDVDPDTITLGGTFRDSATLSGIPAGAPAPTGTMTFTVYRNDTCTGTPAFGPDVVPVTGATTLSPVYTPTQTGTYRVVASYSGDANYNPAGPTACLDPAEDVVVSPATLTLATDVDPDTITLGQTFRDSATLSGIPAGGPVPTGTMTFTVYDNDTCTGTPAFGPDVVPVTGATTLSPVYTPTSTGTYRVVASYSGDANYNAAGPTACLDPAEDVVVTPASLTLATDVDPDTITLGQTFRDSATLSGIPAGGPAPTGTMTFTVYRNDTCTGPPAFGPDVVPVTGATTLSPVYTPTQTGTYRVVASYSGDANYNPAGPTACLDPAEDVVVSPVSLTLATDVNPDSIALGGTFRDTATLSGIPAGAPGPTGTMTFTVYRNDTCTGTPAFGPDVVTVTGTTTLSPIYTPTQTGTYRVVAAYSGDANYNPVGPTACLDPAEDVLVTPAPVTLATDVDPDAITLGRHVPRLGDAERDPGGCSGADRHDDVHRVPQRHVHRPAGVRSRQRAGDRHDDAVAGLHADADGHLPGRRVLQRRRQLPACRSDRVPGSGGGRRRQPGDVDARDGRRPGHDHAGADVPRLGDAERDPGRRTGADGHDDLHGLRQQHVHRYARVRS